MKLLQRLGQVVFGQVEQESEKPAKETLIKADPPPKFDKMKFLQRLMRRRAPKRKNQFANKAMTRGVQRSLERAQRPARLAFIYESMRQANTIAKKRRADYVARRTKRWQGVMEANLPRMFEQELRRQGVGFVPAFP